MIQLSPGRFAVILIALAMWVGAKAPDISGGEFAPSAGMAQKHPEVARWGTISIDAAGVIVLKNWSIECGIAANPGIWLRPGIGLCIDDMGFTITE